MKAVSESTPITIGLAIVLISGIVTVALIGAQTASNAQEISSLKRTFDEELRARSQLLMDLKVDVSVVRAKVENIEKQVDRKK